MGKSKVTIEWSIVGDEWTGIVNKSVSNAEEETRAAATIKSVNGIEMRVAMLAALLFFLLVGDWQWQKQKLVKQTINELQMAVMQEFQAQAALHADAPRASSPTSEPAHVIAPLVAAVRVDGMQRLGNRVMAHVTASYAVEETMHDYRTTLFFEERGEGWLRIEPDPELMGPRQTLETAHFTIHYRSFDADAVNAIAPRLEQLYAKLRRDFALPNANVTTKYRVEITTDEPLHGYYPALTNSTIAILSPTLLSVPVEMSAAAVLYQSMVYPLARLVVVEVINQHKYEWRSNFVLWRHILSGLGLWIMWAEGGALADGRAALVRWNFARLPVQEDTLGQPLPEGYAQICRTYRIWQITSSRHYIPLVCNERDRLALAAQTASSPNLPPPLSWQHDNMDEQTVAQTDSPDSPITIATIIEYVVAAYGPEQLPALIAALGDHKDIKTLIPAVFMVSVEEFEVGWQRYLAEQYGVP